MGNRRGILSPHPENAKPEWYMQPKLVFPPSTPRLNFNKELANYTALTIASAGVGSAAYFIIQRRMELQKGYRKPTKKA